MADFINKRWFNWLIIIIFGSCLLGLVWQYRHVLVDMVLFALCILVLWRAVVRLT